MFWGKVLESGKRYSHKVDATYHLTMAALEPNAKLKGKTLSVMLEHEEEQFILCNLNYDTCLHQSLDLVFAEGEEVAFSVNGDGKVHLTGYLLPEDEFDEFGAGMDEESDSSEKEIVQKKLQIISDKRKLDKEADKPVESNKKAKVESNKPAENKNAVASPNKINSNKSEKEDLQMDSDEDDDDDDDDDDEEFAETFGGKKIVDLDGLDDEDDDDDDLDDEESEDDDDEEEEVKKAQDKLKGQLSDKKGGAKPDFGKKGNQGAGDQKPGSKPATPFQKNQQNQNQQKKQEFNKSSPKGQPFNKQQNNKQFNKGFHKGPQTPNQGGKFNQGTPNSAPNKASNKNFKKKWNSAKKNF